MVFDDGIVLEQIGARRRSDPDAPAAKILAAVVTVDHVVAQGDLVVKCYDPAAVAAEVVGDDIVGQYGAAVATPDATAAG